MNNFVLLPGRVLQNSNTMAANDKSKKFSRWYFGGIGSAGAACCTHPLDLLKVNIKRVLTTGSTILKLIYRCIYKHNKKEKFLSAV